MEWKAIMNLAVGGVIYVVFMGVVIPLIIATFNIYLKEFKSWSEPQKP